MNGDYIIVGDTKNFTDCLVCVAGTYENANKILRDMLCKPTKRIEKYTNFRIKFVEEKDCWWKHNCD